MCVYLCGVGRWVQGVDGEEVGGGAAWTSSPRKLSALQKPELQPVKTMRGTRETLAHAGLGYLLALPRSELLALGAKPPHPHNSCTAPPASFALCPPLVLSLPLFRMLL